MELPRLRGMALGAYGRRGYQRAMTRQPIRILGIDPGLRRTGWGVIEVDGNRLIFVACGSLETDERDESASGWSPSMTGLTRVVDEHAPEEAAVEATFVNKNAAATLKLGQARGVAMLVPAQSRPQRRRIRAQSGEEDRSSAPATARRRRSA